MPTAVSTQSRDLGLHILVEVAGDLRHKRPGWQEYLPLSFGTALHPDDLLRGVPGARGLIVCADMTLVEVSGGYRGGLPCRPAEPILTRGESLVVEPRRDAPLVPSIPYILSPRRSFIRTAHPVLRWHPSSSEIIAYAVRVWGNSLDWQIETTATELVYPDNAPPLEPGTPYNLVVVDENGHSSEEEKTALDRSFALLSAREITVIEALVAQVRGLGLDDRATRFLNGEIYAIHKLRADAIFLFEGLPVEVEAPAISRRLADLCLEVGLYRESREAYERAWAGYQALGDGDGEAATLFGLGLAYWGERDDMTARKYLGQALTVYRSIGDVEGEGRVEAVLAELE